MENLQLLVSIIVPCYNQAQYLPDALGSILMQTYPSWECIIVNDGSTDNTEDVAREWMIKDGRFKYFKKKNGGLSSARNAGLELACGEYIQLLDADDLLETEKIKHQITFLSNSKEKIDVLVAGYRYFQDSDESRDLLIFGPFNLLPEVAVTCDDKKDIIKLFARTNPIVVSAPLYHKGIFQRIGRFDEELDANEDWDFHLRCVLNGILFQHCGYPSRSKTLIRIHGKSMSANRRHMIKSFRKFQQKHKNNPVFALENDLVMPDFKTVALRVLKMLIPPVFVWLARKILGLV